MECYFEFPEDTLYPSIPVYVDETTTVYPLKGKACLTGFEIVTALQQECKLKFIAGIAIPFRVKVVDENDSVYKSDKLR